MVHSVCWYYLCDTIWMIQFVWYNLCDTICVIYFLWYIFCETIFLIQTRYNCRYRCDTIKDTIWEMLTIHWIYDILDSLLDSLYISIITIHTGCLAFCWSHIWHLSDKNGPYVDATTRTGIYVIQNNGRWCLYRCIVS